MFIFFTQYLTDNLNNSNKDERRVTKVNLKKVFDFNNERMRNWTLIVFINYDVDIKKKA